MSEISPINSQVITIVSNDPTNPTGSNANFSNSFQFQVNLLGNWMVSLLSIDYQPAAANTPYYVYTDLVVPQIVGSFNVNLLAVIAGSTGTQPIEYRQPDPQEWRKVATNGFSSAAITIRDGLGNIPVFASPTIVTLLFQKV